MKPKEITKRIIALMLALIMAALCMACSEDGGGNSDGDGGKQTSEGDSGSTASGKKVTLEKCESTGEVGFDKIDIQGKGIIYFTDDETAVFPFSHNGKNGYINDKGEIVFKDDTWEDAGIFSEGKAFVKKGDGWDIIDTNGNVLFTINDSLSGIDPYGNVNFFRNGLAIVQQIFQKRGCYYVIDSNFNIKKYIDNQFDESEEIFTSYYHEIINNESFAGYSFMELYLTPEDGSRNTVKFYDLEDNLVSEFAYYDINTLSIGANYAKIPNKDKDYAIADITTGKLITGYEYRLNDIGTCSDGVIPVCSYDKWGLIDTDGNEVIKPQYAYLSSFSHGLGFALDFDGNGLLINKKGETLASLPDEIFGTKKSLNRVEPFTDSGFALVISYNYETGYLVNEKGEIIFSGDAKSFEYISANYVVYGDDLYKVVVE